MVLQTRALFLEGKVDDKLGHCYRILVDWECWHQRTAIAQIHMVTALPDRSVIEVGDPNRD